LWYATHSTAYYIGVTGGTLTHVSCQAKPGNWYWLKPGANKFNNTHATETALFQTSDGGAFRALCCFDSPGHEGVKGRFRGELGSFDGDCGRQGNTGHDELSRSQPALRISNVTLNHRRVLIGTNQIANLLNPPFKSADSVGPDGLHAPHAFLWFEAIEGRQLVLRGVGNDEEAVHLDDLEQ
jgi:hypothetical protein